MIKDIKMLKKIIIMQEFKNQFNIDFGMFGEEILRENFDEYKDLNIVNEKKL